MFNKNINDKLLKIKDCSFVKQFLLKKDNLENLIANVLISFTINILHFIREHKFVVIFLIILLLFFHPTNETMICNSHYQCKIKYEFINFIHFDRNLTLTPNSIISYKIGYKPGGRFGGYHRVNIYFDNINPFIMYLKQERTSHGLEDYYNILENNFYDYLKKPNNEFFISSSANSFSTFFYLVLLIILVCFFIL